MIRNIGMNKMGFGRTASFEPLVVSGDSCANPQIAINPLKIEYIKSLTSKDDTCTIKLGNNSSVQVKDDFRNLVTDWKRSLNTEA